MKCARITFGLVFLLSSSAVAETVDPFPEHGHPMGNGGICGTPRANPQRKLNAGTPSKIIYLERCVGGCTFTGDTSHDAGTDKIAISGTTPGMVYSFPEFKNFAGQSGTAADAEWNQIVECVRKVYGYYDTEVTDVRPASGSYHRAVVAGLDTDLGLSGLLGISDVSCDGPIHNMNSFTFAEDHRPFAGSSARYVQDVCVTVTHEAGHSFGLEHQFEFVDGTSACNDPMSYDTGECNPPFRFFRNKPAKCGGFELMNCVCTPVANSHVELSAVFGAAAVIAPSTADIVQPVADAQLGTNIVSSAGNDRGVERIELYINGFKWATQPGLAFQPGGGQPTPGSYLFPVPATLPNSIVDIHIRVYDDLGNFTDSEVRTAVKGSACADASTCAAGQKCEQGRCFWDPPVGEIGDDCTYPEFCLSGQCSNTSINSETAICTQTCIVGTANACPEGLECFDTGNSGVCYLPTDGGCCSASTSTPWGPFALAGVVFGFVLRRRRRR